MRFSDINRKYADCITRNEIELLNKLEVPVGKYSPGELHPPSSTLILLNLQNTIKHDDLINFIERCGIQISKVVEVLLSRNIYTNTVSNKLFTIAFVGFDCIGEATKAKKSINGKCMNHNKLFVEYFDRKNCSIPWKGWSLILHR